MFLLIQVDWGMAQIKYFSGDPLDNRYITNLFCNIVISRSCLLIPQIINLLPHQKKYRQAISEYLRERFQIKKSRKMMEILIFLIFYNVIGCYADLNRIYLSKFDTHETEFCDLSKTKSEYLNDFTEESLLSPEICGGYKYATVQRCINDYLEVNCCNDTTNWTQTIIANSEERNFCSNKTFDSKNIYGAPIENAQTVFELIPGSWYTSEKDGQSYSYVACVKSNLLELSHHGIQTNLIGWSVTNTYYVDENLTKFRIWDFSGDCQIHWPENSIGANYPTGRNIETAALYANYEFDWSSLIIPSVPDFDTEIIDAENNQIEKLFRQFVQVILDPDDIILDLENGELNLTEYAGTFECVFQCKINNDDSLELAIVSKNACFCTGYETIDGVLEVVDYDSNLEPDDYVSVFHLDPEAGHNFGYKFWQAVHYPTFFHLFEDWFDIVSEIPHVNTSMETPSKCLELCNDHDFEIAILHNSINDTDNFDCLCLYSEFFKFTMQDLASTSIEKYYKHWCPDLDGPCTQDDSNLSSTDYSIVYCLDDAVCNEQLLILPSTEYTNHEVCQEGHQLHHPKFYLNNSYFECVNYFDLIQKYRQFSCDDDDQLFYPIIGSCEDLCYPGNITCPDYNSSVFYECETVFHLDFEQYFDVWKNKTCPDGYLCSLTLSKCSEFCDEDSIGEVKAISEDDDNCISDYLECQDLEVEDHLEYFWIEKTCEDGTVFSPALERCSYYCNNSPIKSTTTLTTMTPSTSPKTTPMSTTTPTIILTTHKAIPPTFYTPPTPQPMNLTTISTQDDCSFKNYTVIDGTNITNQKTDTVEDCQNLCCNLIHDTCHGFTWYSGNFSGGNDK